MQPLQECIGAIFVGERFIIKVGKPYDGNFINKTWNTDADKLDPNFKKVGRTELLQGWCDGVYDLTWHCLKCHASILRRSNDLRGVANDMGLCKFSEERTRHNREREQYALQHKRAVKRRQNREC